MLAYSVYNFLEQILHMSKLVDWILLKQMYYFINLSPTYEW